MRYEFFQVDAFTDQAFCGNPAAVFLLPAAKPESWMQNVAAEMNLSETAFLVAENGGYHLRWFTPTTEVDLCGHGTLAAAHALYETGASAPATTLHFRTRGGDLRVRREGTWLELDFPRLDPAPKAIAPKVLAALGVEPLQQSSGRTVYDDLVEIASEDQLRALRPSLSALTLNTSSRGYIVTTRGSGGYDFVSRYFNPGAGIPEDPVTGSIHCALAPYWAEKLGKNELRAFQASRRGGELKLRVDKKRVFIAGKAVTTVQGWLLNS